MAKDESPFTELMRKTNRRMVDRREAEMAKGAMLGGLSIAVSSVLRLNQRKRWALIAQAALGALAVVLPLRRLLRGEYDD